MLIDGARMKDEGLWSCEIGTIKTKRDQRSVSPWTLVGDINIEVRRKSSSQDKEIERNNTTESLTGVIKEGLFRGNRNNKSTNSFAAPKTGQANF